jgi:hypothetical protein
MTKEYEVRSSELWDAKARFTILDDGNGFTMDGPMAPLRRVRRGCCPRWTSSARRGCSSRSSASGSSARSSSPAPSASPSTPRPRHRPALPARREHPAARADEGRHAAPHGRADAGPGHADLPDNEWGRPVRDAVKRGDIGGISFRWAGSLESWKNEKLADGYTGPVRHLHEIQLRREVSLVTFPAYDTPASVRALAEEAEVDPDTLVDALKALKPEARLTVEQREALITVINKHSDVPVLGADEANKLTQMRERLLALAG